jgi:hypothetical protein
MQNERVEGAEVNEPTRLMSATTGEDDGTIVISRARIYESIGPTISGKGRL